MGMKGDDLGMVLAWRDGDGYGIVGLMAVGLLLL